MRESRRPRLALWYAGVYGLVLVAFASLVYTSLDRALYRGVEEGALVVARSVQATLHPGPDGLHIDRPQFEDVAGDASLFQGVAAVEVLDPKGNVVARHGLALAPVRAGAAEDETADASGNPLWVHSQPIMAGDRPIGLLRIARPLSDLQRTLHDFALELAVLVLGALLATVAAGVWLAGLALAPVQAAYEHLRRFTADASHELRTPVAIVLAQADMALAAAPGDVGTRQQGLEAIQRAGRRMATLVADLLFLARSDAAGLELQMTRLDLDELVESLVEEYLPLAREKGLALEIETEAVAVQADPQRLHQLVANLVDNAIKYTDAGRVQVSVFAGAPPAPAVVKVTDTGCGIAPEHLPHVFERFYRTDDARSSRRPGSGLGLAIARAIAYHHHAELRVASETGAGTEVTLTIPRA